MERVYWNEDREPIQPAALPRLEHEVLWTQLDYVWSSSPFYQTKFAQAGIRREAIGDVVGLPLLPFTERDECRSSSSGLTKPLARQAGRSMLPSHARVAI
jgi:phenylacetate-coenzyme A ligase PaaK-like adenylate-forming protein